MLSEKPTSQFMRSWFVGLQEYDNGYVRTSFAAEEAKGGATACILPFFCLRFPGFAFILRGILRFVKPDCRQFPVLGKPFAECVGTASVQAVL